MAPGIVRAETRCDASTARQSLTAETLCACDVVTAGMLRYIRRSEEFLRVLAETTEMCPGFASVLTDAPTATIAASDSSDGGGAPGGGSAPGDGGDTGGGDTGGGDTGGGDTGGGDTGGGDTGGGDTGGGDTGGGTGGGGTGGGGSKGNNGGGNGSEGASPGKGSGANDDES